MWFDKHYGDDKVRLDCVIKSRDVSTHSMMQDLSEQDVEEIKTFMTDLLKLVASKIPRKKNG